MPPAAEAQPMAATGQPAAVQPQGAFGGCVCGAQPQQGMSPFEQVVMPAQKEGWPVQQVFNGPQVDPRLLETAQALRPSTAAYGGG